MKNIKVALSLCLLLVITFTNASVKCRIDFQIKGLENKNVLFACEYGEKQLVIDTIPLDKEAKGFYESKEKLQGGIYVIAFPSGKYFELLVNDELFFSLFTDTAQVIFNMIVEGSEETQWFLQYQILNERLLKYKSNADSTKSIKNQVTAFKGSIIKYHAESFLSKYFLLQQDPVMPISKNDTLSRELFLKKHAYLKSHYFDNADFQDSRILRTRLLFEKLSFYFNILVSQNADSICREMDQLLVKSKTNNESYRYVLNFLMNNYKLPQKPFQEKVLVYLADNYYLNGNATWADPLFLKLLKERTDAMRLALTGVKAANLALQKPDGTPLELYKIKAKYLILFFFSPDCNICQKEAKELNEWYEKNHKGIEILAIYTHADKSSLIDFINTSNYKWTFAYDPLLKSNFSKLYQVNETPKMYLLDENKNILEKGIRTAQLKTLEL